MSRKTIVGLEAEVRELNITVEEQGKLLDAAEEKEKTMLQEVRTAQSLHQQEMEKSYHLAKQMKCDSDLLHGIIADQAKALANMSRKN